MAAENPLKKAPEFYNPEEHDRLAKSGNFGFADLSSIPTISSPEADPNPKSPTNTTTISNPNLSSSDPNISRRRAFKIGSTVIGVGILGFAGGFAWSARQSRIGEISPPSTPDPRQLNRVPTTTIAKSPEAVSTPTGLVINPEAERLRQLLTRMPSPTADVKPTLNISIQPTTVVEQPMSPIAQPENETIEPTASSEQPAPDSDDIFVITDPDEVPNQPEDVEIIPNTPTTISDTDENVQTEHSPTEVMDAPEDSNVAPIHEPADENDPSDLLPETGEGLEKEGDE